MESKLKASELAENLAEPPPKMLSKSWAFGGPKIGSRSSEKEPLKELEVRVDLEDPRSKGGGFEEEEEEEDIGADLPEGLKP